MNVHTKPPLAHGAGKDARKTPRTSGSIYRSLLALGFVFVAFLAVFVWYVWRSSGPEAGQAPVSPNMIQIPSPLPTTTAAPKEVVAGSVGGRSAAGRETPRAYGYGRRDSYPGSGVGQDYGKALERYRRAAEQGNTTAQFRLGLMYAKGQGVLKSDEEAAYWYSKAAEQGHRSAQLYLGLMYANGQGVPRDAATAVYWYGKAADQGDVTAQFKLGLIYENGQGVPKDDAGAVEWYRKAAEQGHKPAQDALTRKGLGW